MRKRLEIVGYLIRVHDFCELCPQSLFLAVQVMDSYITLDTELAAQPGWPMVALTALLIAAKFEGPHAPRIEKLVSYTEDCSCKAIIEMEMHMLKALQFDISYPTAMSFFGLYQAIHGCTQWQALRAQYFLELTLMDTCMLKYVPEQLAAACLLYSVMPSTQPRRGASVVAEQSQTVLSIGLVFMVCFCCPDCIRKIVLRNVDGKFMWVSI